MKMLVVDDSKTMRSFLSAMGDDLNFEVSEACDGQEGIEIVDQEDPFDLLLVDWNMPRMNGIEFIKEVRLRPEYKETKILMITSENDMEKLTAAYESGVSEFLMKPLTQEMFNDKLKLLGVINHESQNA